MKNRYVSHNITTIDGVNRNRTHRQTFCTSVIFCASGPRIIFAHKYYGAPRTYLVIYR